MRSEAPVLSEVISKYARSSLPVSVTSTKSSASGSWDNRASSPRGSARALAAPRLKALAKTSEDAFIAASIAVAACLWCLCQKRS